MKRSKLTKSSQLPPRYKKSKPVNASEKRDFSSILRNKVNDIDLDKVNAKIFKQLEEGLSILEETDQYNKGLNKLIIIDKLCYSSFDETDVVSVFVKYLMIFCYYKCHDLDRGVRHIETFTKRVFELYKKRKLKRETANLLLHIHKIWADILMRKEKYSNAAETYQELIDLYGIWRSCSYRTTQDYGIDYQEYEFTEDHILEVKSSSGEALMNIGETLLAIDRFEDAKRQYQQCLILSNELIYINICNQLANGYIRINKKDKALENFEISLKTLENTKDELPVDNIVLAKIQSNIASIYLEKGKILDAIKLYQNGVKLKRQKLPEHHEEIEISYGNLADAYVKAKEYTEAYEGYDRAYEVSKNLYGKQHKTTAKYILNCARMKFKCEEYEDAIKLYEYGAKLYQFIEKGLGKQGKVIYLKLIEIHSHLRNDSKTDTLVAELLEALEVAKNTEEKYVLYNDLANIQKKHGQHKLAVEIYKRSLQTIKVVHRNDYMYLKQTSKILVNLGDAYKLMESYQNAVKYLEHALNVMSNAYPMANSESAKVQLKLAEAQAKCNIKNKAIRNYEQGLDILDNLTVKDSMYHNLKQTAKQELNELRSSLLA